MKKLKKLLITITLILLVIFVALNVYSMNYYEADESAIDLLEKDYIEEIDGYVELNPEEKSDIGIIFYPGGKVEHYAYLPIMNKLREKGVNSFLVKMPFKLAIFNKNAADNIIKNNPNISEWYIIGHSLGGAMGSSYANENSKEIKGLFLLGAYNYGEYDKEKTLIFYGTEDEILDKSKIKKAEVVGIIDGGNHAYFGNYGKQKGDGEAIISQDEQQNIVVTKIMEFINKN
ncbi:alpha/beta hydrolase [Miniphocaeibacter massiliensis]|uniref:alpha/beta hydrolase n=1 Tax=Miniphocaeibacter massiliensis TaxID=2041841 RepID=UPI000C1C627C|nr:alpha/beta hydrolase [Miniphocaeibacter massiliensis]